MALIATALIMFVVALPRNGQVVGFLRNRNGVQAFYMMLIISLLALGLVITAAGG
jgi:hypothetical protein